MVSRRELIKLLGASGLAAALPHIAFARAPGDMRLIVIVLRGGMDGLDVVQPYGDKGFAALRPGANNQGFMDLDGFYALNPHAAPLHALFKSNEVGFIQAVATPYRSRSHFDGQDVLENGTTAAQGATSGWLNRLAGTLAKGDENYAVDVGTGGDLILRGPMRFRNWYPETKLEFLAQSGQFLTMLYQDDPLMSEALKGANASGERSMDLADTDPGVSAREVAALVGKFLNEDARIAAFSVLGWDTHVNQNNRLKVQMTRLSDTITELKAALGANWKNTAIVACSEFGRTARMNGSGGTDHGSGGLALLAGGAVAGGKVLGEWPGLGDGDLYENRDLKPTEDIRRYIAWLATGLYGVPKDKFTTEIFPGLDMGQKLVLV